MTPPTSPDRMDTTTGAEQLLEVCRRTIDPTATAVRCHGSRVLRVATCRGEVIVKLHHRPDRHQQELYAYLHWTSALGDRAPRLLAATDEPPALVVTALAGQPVTACSLSRNAEREAQRRAGALLRDFHNAGPPLRTLDIPALLHQRGMAWLEVARDVIHPWRRAEIADHLSALRALGPIASVPCHLDFTPANILLDDKGILRAIDFEHARYDLAARDLVRLATRTWTDRPDLEEAFQATYGMLTELDRQVITHCTHLDDLTRTARIHGLGLSEDTASLYVIHEGQAHVNPY